MKKKFMMLSLFPDERYKFRKRITCIQETAYLYSDYGKWQKELTKLEIVLSCLITFE